MYFRPRGATLISLGQSKEGNGSRRNQGGNNPAERVRAG